MDGNYSLADIAAATGNGRNNDGMFGGDGAWWLIVLFLFVFCGWGNNGWGNNGNGGGYAATAATQADIQRGFDNSAVISKLDGINSGLCDGFYAMNNGMLIDPANIQTELAEWKKKAEDAEKEFNAKIYDRDFSDALKAALDDVKFSSEAAKKSVMADIKEAGLKLKNGKILGLNDLIEQMKQSDASAFVDESQQQAQQNQARFTTHVGQQQTPGSMTKKDIEAIKDPSERQAAIAQNIQLFQ